MDNGNNKVFTETDALSWIMEAAENIKIDKPYQLRNESISENKHLNAVHSKKNKNSNTVKIIDMKERVDGNDLKLNKHVGRKSKGREELLKQTDTEKNYKKKQKSENLEEIDSEKFKSLNFTTQNKNVQFIELDDNGYSSNFSKSNVNFETSASSELQTINSKGDIILDESVTVEEKYLTKAGKSLTVTLVFYMKRGHKIGQQTFHLKNTILDVKEEIANQMDISSSAIHLTINESQPDDFKILEEIGATSGSTIMTLIELIPKTQTKEKEMFVNVQDSEGEIIDKVYVTLENAPVKKPFLGGYKCSSSGLEYHHAECQTAPRTRPLVLYKAERSSQTATYRNKEQNTFMDKATQMPKRNLYISNKNDKILTSKKYESSEEYENRISKIKVAAVITIQRYVRGWLAREKVAKMKVARKKQKEWENKAKQIEVEKKNAYFRNRITGHVMPRSKEDFEMLYSMVEAWRESEVDRITTNTTGASRKAYLYALLEKEVHLLRAIDKMKIKVQSEIEKKKETEFLEKCSEPIAWQGYNKMNVSMDTVRIQRAREIKELYAALCNDDVTVAERKELLLNIKYSLLHYKIPIVREIIVLIDRECDLLCRGFNTSELDNLKQRIKILFLDLAKDPQINPEVTVRFSKNRNKSTETLLCSSCNELKHFDSFKLDTKSRNCRVCTQCGWRREDLSYYRHMMNLLRKDEMKRCSYTSVAFIMKEDDFKSLVRDVWDSKSVLSYNSDIKKLRLCRWKIKEDWSPWNCVVLTDDEQKAHYKCTDVKSIYDTELISQVEHRLQMAKVMFSQLIICDKELAGVSKWTKVRCHTGYVPPPAKYDIE